MFTGTTNREKAGNFAVWDYRKKLRNLFGPISCVRLCVRKLFQNLPKGGKSAKIWKLKAKPFQYVAIN
jgi:hypothetical protein